MPMLVIHEVRVLTEAHGEPLPQAVELLVVGWSDRAPSVLDMIVIDPATAATIRRMLDARPPR